MKNISLVLSKYKKNNSLFLSNFIQFYFLLRGGNLVFFFYLKNYFFKFSNKNITNSKLSNNKQINQVFNSFLVFFMRFGKKILNFKFLTKSFLNIFNIIFLSNFQNFKNYSFLKEFLFNVKLNKSLNNVVYILNWSLFWYEPIFSIKCSVVPKKYRKKIKKKYLYKIAYLNSTKRKNVAVKGVLSYLNTFKNYSVLDRLTLTLSDVIFNFKNSYIYKRKLVVYKKIFRL